MHLVITLWLLYFIKNNFLFSMFWQENRKHLVQSSGNIKITQGDEHVIIQSVPEGGCSSTEMVFISNTHSFSRHCTWKIGLYICHTVRSDKEHSNLCSLCKPLVIQKTTIVSKRQQSDNTSPRKWNFFSCQLANSGMSTFAVINILDSMQRAPILTHQHSWCLGALGRVSNTFWIFHNSTKRILIPPSP